MFPTTQLSLQISLIEHDASALIIFIFTMSATRNPFLFDILSGLNTNKNLQYNNSNKKKIYDMFSVKENFWGTEGGRDNGGKKKVLGSNDWTLTQKYCNTEKDAWNCAVYCK